MMTTTIDAENDSNRHTLNFNGVNDVYLVLNTLMKSLVDSVHIKIKYNSYLEKRFQCVSGTFRLIADQIMQIL